MSETQEKKWIISGLILIGIILSIVSFYTGIPAGGADNYAHFNISHWAFRYPHLFLDHWGKPLYTILAAPFAQFGFVAVRILNSVLGLITAWFVWKLARLLKYNFSWFAVVVTIFTPIYFTMMSTGMTEILFSLILVVSIYLFFKENYIYSAILISFIFLARTEGLAFELLFLTGFLLKKQFRAIPFLATGFILFSFIGWMFYYHDFWWLITQRPYANENSMVYGRGTLFHYFKGMPNYLGIWIAILLVTGTLAQVRNWFYEKLKFNGSDFFQILLILGTFWGYFFIHSYLWWKGETSAGLLRVMAGVSPLIGIIALSVISFAERIIRRNSVKSGLLVIISGLLVFNSVKYYLNSTKNDLTIPVKNSVTEWLVESGNLKHKLVIHDPYFAFSTEIDAWDLEVVQYDFSDSNIPENNLPDSTLFIWDAQFSANEGELPLQKIIDNPNFEVVKIFEPETPFKVLGNNDYKIVVFRIIQGKGVNNLALIQQLKNEELEKGIYHVEKYDFETPFPEPENENRRVQKPDSFGFAFDMTELEFSPAFSIPSESLDISAKNIFRISAELIKTDSIEKNRLLLVFSVEKNQKSEHYETRDLGEQIMGKSVWYKTDCIFYLPDNKKGKSTIKIYVWNIDKKSVAMDNFKLEISKQTEN